MWSAVASSAVVDGSLVPDYGVCGSPWASGICDGGDYELVSSSGTGEYGYTGRGYVVVYDYWEPVGNVDGADSGGA